MKKKNKKEVKVVGKLKPREINKILCDTKPDEILLDLSAQGKSIEGLLNLEKTYVTRENVTVSWRIPKDLLKHAKELAKKESLIKKRDIHYQKLIMGCFLEKYPITEE